MFADQECFERQFQIEERHRDQLRLPDVLWPWHRRLQVRRGWSHYMSYYQSSPDPSWWHLRSSRIETRSWGRRDWSRGVRSMSPRTCHERSVIINIIIIIIIINIIIIIIINIITVTLSSNLSGQGEQTGTQKIHARCSSLEPSLCLQVSFVKCNS